MSNLTRNTYTHIYYNKSHKKLTLNNKHKVFLKTRQKFFLKRFNTVYSRYLLDIQYECLAIKSTRTKEYLKIDAKI